MPLGFYNAIHLSIMIRSGASTTMLALSSTLILYVGGKLAIFLVQKAIGTSVSIFYPLVGYQLFKH